MLNGLAHLIPVLRHGQTKNHLQVRAHAEVLTLVADHQRIETLVRDLNGAMQHLEHVLVKRIRFGMELEQRNAVADVPQTRARVGLDRLRGTP